MLKEEELSIEKLLKAGAHFGHQNNRKNPKMDRYVLENRGGISIIDLSKTMKQVQCAAELLDAAITNHKTILFVGTKNQAKVVVKEMAEEAQEFYVCERWLGGMLTNLMTIRKSVKILDNLEKKLVSDKEMLTKKELMQIEKKRDKLNRHLSGIRSMRKVPGLLIVVDIGKEHIAVAEAKKLNIPIIGLVDTNHNPDVIDNVIACNDDSIKSIKLILQALSNKIIDKKKELNMYSSQEKDELNIEKVEKKEGKYD